MGLSDSVVISVIAVSEMGPAREFYEGKVGLTNGSERSDGGVRYPCGGDTSVHVYPSPGNAGKSPATLSGWRVDDIEATVDELAGRGVTFEQYESGPIATNEKGIAELEGVKSAWFKDPDGNILSLVEG